MKTLKIKILSLKKKQSLREFRQKNYTAFGEFFLKIYNPIGGFLEENDTQTWGTSLQASQWDCPPPRALSDRMGILRLIRLYVKSQNPLKMSLTLELCSFVSVPNLFKKEVKAFDSFGTE